MEIPGYVVFVSWFAAKILNCQYDSDGGGATYSVVWTVVELLTGTGCAKSAFLWLLGSPSGQWIRLVGDETQERFKCNFAGRVGGSFEGLRCVCLPRPLRLLERGLLTLEMPLQTGRPNGVVFRGTECDWYLNSLVVNMTR